MKEIGICFPLKKKKMFCADVAAKSWGSTAL